MIGGMRMRSGMWMRGWVERREKGVVGRVLWVRSGKGG